MHHGSPCHTSRLGLAQVPDDWLEQAPDLGSPTAVRAAYRDHLLARVGSGAWLPGGAR